MWLSASQAGERNLGQEEEQDQELRRQKRIHGPSRSRRAIKMEKCLSWCISFFGESLPIAYGPDAAAAWACRHTTSRRNALIHAAAPRAERLQLTRTPTRR